MPFRFRCLLFSLIPVSGLAWAAPPEQPPAASSTTAPGPAALAPAAPAPARAPAPMAPLPAATATPPAAAADEPGRSTAPDSSTAAAPAPDAAPESASQPAPEAAPEPADDEAETVKQVAPAQAVAVLGADVRFNDGAAVGRIVDILVNASGMPEAAVLDCGGFMGVGSRKVAVSWNTLHFAPTEQGGSVTTDLTPDKVRSAPEYKDAKPAAVVASPPPGVNLDLPPASLAPVGLVAAPPGLPFLDDDGSTPSAPSTVPAPPGPAP